TLNKARLNVRRALEVMRDVAEAVDYAHKNGVVHRDLKPSNLSVDEDGHAWVMDFGLARRLHGGTTLTADGSVVGTPAYMPPEQASGEKCDERSDVYSLGAPLYDLLTGQVPFEAGTVFAVLAKVVHEDPVSLRHHNPKLPGELETIVRKAMEK